MLRITNDQLNSMLCADRRLLINDIEEWLGECRPEIVAAYPRPYLRWVIDDSVGIAATFGIDDARTLRVFVRLRWDIAPGYHRQPDIARVLADRSLTPAQRFDRLATEAYAEAWEDAARFDGPREWRERFIVEEEP